jgi:hypothetical protein
VRYSHDGRYADWKILREWLNVLTFTSAPVVVGTCQGTVSSRMDEVPV